MRHSTCAAGLVMLASLGWAACGGSADTGNASDAQMALSGRIEIDGSSTVFPITEAVAEDFGISTGGGVRVSVAYSGTGGGFKRFCTGETDISDASRPIKDSEIDQCAQNGVDYITLDVALDGLAVVVNPSNTFADCFTVAELRKIWEPGSTVKRWSDVRAGWPSDEIKLYGPGTNSGTFDYFTEAVNGKEDASRADYTASEDDNVLVQGVEGDRFSLGYFGFAYYWSNRERLRIVPVDGGSGCVTPTEATITSGEYRPLSRPLFIYVSRKALARPEVKAFVDYYLEHAGTLVPQTGYVALDAEGYQVSKDALAQAVAGR